MKHSPHLAHPAEFSGAPEGMPLERSSAPPVEITEETITRALQLQEQGALTELEEQFLDALLLKLDRYAVDSFGLVDPAQAELLECRHEKRGANGAE